ncbi:MAG: DUF86 domain-containing protein [Nanoarchaeota archaeon]
MNIKEDSVFIMHIIDSIKAIEDFSKNLSREKLNLDRLRQSAIVREIEIIGEASKNISEDFKKKHIEIPWKGIIGTRDKMIHHYFGINLDVVWEIIKENLPDLKKKLSKIK